MTGGDRDPYRKLAWSKAQLAKEVVERVENCRRAKAQLARLWEENRAFFQGHQFAQVNLKSGRLYEKAPPKHRSRIVSNMVRPTLQTAIAKLTQNQPGWSVLPGSDEEEDRDSARVSQSYLEHVFQELEFGGLLEDVLLFAFIEGTGFLKISWDFGRGPERVEEIPYAEGDERLLDEEGREVPRTDLHHEGAVAFTVLSSLDIFPDPTGHDSDSWQWAVTAHQMHIDQADWQWPEFAGRFEPRRNPAGADLFSWALADRFLGMSADTNEDRVVVFEQSERPTLAFPEGRRLVVHPAIEEPIEMGPLPYAPSFPIVDFAVDRMPGVAWGDGKVQALRGLQTARNGAVSKAYQGHRVGVLKWMSPKGSVEKEAIDDQEGEVVEYDHSVGPAPLPVTPQPVAPSIFSLVQLFDHDFEEVSGVHEVSKGGADLGSSVSGRLVAYLSAQDDTKLGPLVDRIEKRVARVGAWALRLAHEHLPPESMVRILGSDRETEVRTFYKNSIRSYDVRVQPGSMRPVNKALRQEQVLTAWTTGLLQDPAEVRELLEFGAPARLQGDRTAATRWAQDNIAALLESRPVDLHPFDIMPKIALETLFRETQRFCMSKKFRNLAPLQREPFYGYLRALQIPLAKLAQLPLGQWTGGAPPAIPGSMGLPGSLSVQPPERNGAVGQMIQPGVDTLEEARPLA